MLYIQILSIRQQRVRLSAFPVLGLYADSFSPQRKEILAFQRVITKSRS